MNEQTIASCAAALFQADLALSRAITRRSWRERAWFDRLRESIAGTLDRVLDSWRRP